MGCMDNRGPGRAQFGRNDHQGVTPSPGSTMSNLLRFHVYVYGRPEQTSAGSSMNVHGRVIIPVVCDRASLLLSWEITFDEASTALATLPRMFLEPDGSF